MPRVTQYIRDEDFDKWKALPNKSEFIHKALTYGYDASEEPGPAIQRFEITERPKRKPGYCYHGVPRRECTKMH